jgi:hypothetical protein
VWECGSVGVWGLGVRRISRAYKMHGNKAHRGPFGALRRTPSRAKVKDKVDTAGAASSAPTNVKGKVKCTADRVGSTLRETASPPNISRRARRPAPPRNWVISGPEGPGCQCKRPHGLKSKARSTRRARQAAPLRTSKARSNARREGDPSPTREQIQGGHKGLPYKTALPGLLKHYRMQLFKATADPGVPNMCEHRC